ncbi:MAG: hypothetical protein VST68_00220 [Nitrospirota bacterium]|nr:hypothetical protein [Nitrospirota bacterium]
MKLFTWLLILCVSVGLFSLAWAGTADVVDAQAACSGHEQLVCQFTVTVRHTDDGTSHYADRWEVLSLDGNLLKTRKLHHPHVKEQPFTRSVSGVRIPPSTKQVRIRAHDSVHGYGGKDLIIDLPH